MEYGYARVSSLSQNLDRQIRELVKHGLSRENIFTDKYSGKTINRPGFQELLKKVQKGDVIYVTSFDRFGRNYNETVEIWNYLTKKKKLTWLYWILQYWIREKKHVVKWENSFRI